MLAFKFLADLGLKKPSFLPDFGKSKRVNALVRFFGPIDEAVYREVLADDARIVEMLRDEPSRTFTKGEWIDFMMRVKAAVPDFTWAAATEGSKGDDGYCIVSVMGSGHHKGGDFLLGDLPPIPPTGRRFCLSREVIKAKVDGGKIRELQVLPVRGAGPLALYKALAGEVSV